MYHVSSRFRLGVSGWMRKRRSVMSPNSFFYSLLACCPSLCIHIFRCRWHCLLHRGSTSKPKPLSKDQRLIETGARNSQSNSPDRSRLLPCSEHKIIFTRTRKLYLQAAAIVTHDRPLSQPNSHLSRNSLDHFP